ncbi:MAG: hypothetical protein ACLTDR_13370 [Adlercreutzia equolifaciens]
MVDAVRAPGLLSRLLLRSVGDERLDLDAVGLTLGNALEAHPCPVGLDEHLLGLDLAGRRHAVREQALRERGVLLGAQRPGRAQGVHHRRGAHARAVPRHQVGGLLVGRRRRRPRPEATWPPA